MCGDRDHSISRPPIQFERLWVPPTVDTKTTFVWNQNQSLKTNGLQGSILKPFQQSENILINKFIN
jgi:hypothetical protein